MRVRNQHTAMVEGILPGAEGEVDASRPGVQGFLRAEMLVAALDDAEAAETIARSPIADAVRGVDTLVGAQARVRALETELNDIEARFAASLAADGAEHTAALDAAQQESARLRDELATLTVLFEERGAALASADAELNKLRVDLDAATAPTAATEAPSTGRVRRNG